MNPEFLIHAGNFIILWLARLFTSKMKSGNFPTKFEQTDITILNYRPIGLLGPLNTLFE